jgi:hypothetical protein
MGGAEAAMRGTRRRGFSSFRASSDSRLDRIRENVRQLFVSARLAPASANGAPIHLLKFERSTNSGRGQTLSLLTHVAVIALISLVASRAIHDKAEPKPQVSVSIGRLVYSPETDHLRASLLWGLVPLVASTSRYPLLTDSSPRDPRCSSHHRSYQTIPTTFFRSRRPF